MADVHRNVDVWLGCSDRRAVDNVRSVAGWQWYDTVLIDKIVRHVCHDIVVDNIARQSIGNEFMQSLTHSILRR